MPTKNPRINITFEETAADLLASLAKKERKSISRLSKELILEALERREDLALSTLAGSRDTQKIQKVKHKDAWK